MYQNYYSFLRKIAKTTPFLISTFVCARNVRKAIFSLTILNYFDSDLTREIKDIFTKFWVNLFLKPRLVLKWWLTTGYPWHLMPTRINFFQKNIPAKYLKLISKTPKGIFLLRTYLTIAEDLPRILSPRKCCCSLHWLWKWGIASGNEIEWLAWIFLNFSSRRMMYHNLKCFHADIKHWFD